MGIRNIEIRVKQICSKNVPSFFPMKSWTREFSFSVDPVILDLKRQLAITLTLNHNYQKVKTYKMLTFSNISMIDILECQL